MSLTKQTQNLIERIVDSILTEIIFHKDIVILREEIETLQTILANLDIERVVVNLKLTPSEKKIKVWDQIEDKIEGMSYAGVLVRRLADADLYEFIAGANFPIVIQEVEKQIKKYKIYEFTTAIEFAPEDMQKFRKKVSEKLKHNVFFRYKIRQNIVAGFILNKGSEIIDASVQTKLENYRSAWVNNLNKMINADS